MDNYLRDIYFTTANKFYPAADYSDSGAEATVATVLDDNVLSAAKLIASNLNMPMFRRGGMEFYVFVGTPEQIMQIRKRGI